MKVKILKKQSENTVILDIKVEEYMDVKMIKSLINENERGKELLIEEPYFLIYNNIILNDNKMIEYYKIDPNEQIWAAQLEDYLQHDQIIVEVFVMRFNPDNMHLIIKSSDTIAHIKLLTNNIVTDIGNIINKKGQPMADDQSVADIADNGIDHKLIILCDDCIDIEFDNFCKIHDRFIVHNYWRKYIFYNGWIRGDIYVSNRNRLIPLVGKWKSVLLSNFVIDCKPDVNLFLIPPGLLNSRWLACEYLTERIYGICEDYLKLVKKDIGLEEDSKNRNFIFDAIQCSIFNSIKCRANELIGIDKSLETILIDAIDYLVHFVTNPSMTGMYWMKLFVDEFIFTPSDTIEMSEITFETYTDLRLIVNQYKYDVSVPISVETVIQTTKAASMQTGFAVDRMYLVKRGSDVQPQEDDKIDGIYNYFVEIVDNFDCLKDESTVGEGSFGSVFRYFDKENQNFIILKEQNFENKDLYRDISIQSLIQPTNHFIHRNRLINKNGHVCLTMEYMSMGSLKSYLEIKKYLLEDEIAKISYQILKQIDYLHKRYIIHRDIKSENIVLDEHNNAKLIDFGLSKFTVGLSEKSLEERLKSYAPGTMCYMAPELLMDQRYTDKIDIWSYGIVMIEMVTGKVPFPNLSAPLFIQTIKTKQIKYKAPFQLSEKLTSFIDCALKKDPNVRFSANQLLEMKFIQDSLKLSK